MMNDTPVGHLESSEVAAYVDRALAPAQRERVEAHLADCAECRREVIDVSRVGNIARRRSSWIMFAPAAAAAAIVILLLARSGETPPGGGPVLRDGGGGSRSGVVLVAPAEDGRVREHSVTFIWRSAGAGVSYRLTLTNEQGDVVWSTTGSDTTTQLPAAVGLKTGSQYHWYVDGLLRDGSSIASAVQQFTVP